jgi:hypothetical protein
MYDYGEDIAINYIQWEWNPNISWLSPVLKERSRYLHCKHGVSIRRRNGAVKVLTARRA